MQRAEGRVSKARRSLRRMLTYAGVCSELSDASAKLDELCDVLEEKNTRIEYNRERLLAMDKKLKASYIDIYEIAVACGHVCSVCCSRWTRSSRPYVYVYMYSVCIYSIICMYVCVCVYIKICNGEEAQGLLHIYIYMC